MAATRYFEAITQAYVQKCPRCCKTYSQVTRAIAFLRSPAAHNPESDIAHGDNPIPTYSSNFSTPPRLMARNFLASVPCFCPQSTSAIGAPQFATSADPKFVQVSASPLTMAHAGVVVGKLVLNGRSDRSHMRTPKNLPAAKFAVRFDFKTINHLILLTKMVNRGII